MPRAELTLKLHTELVVRESDGKALFLVWFTYGKRIMDMRVVEPPDEDDDG